jgi:Tol biopolymer transport system component
MTKLTLVVATCLLAGCSGDGEESKRRPSAPTSYDLYSIAVDGSDLRRLTRTDRAHEQHLAVSSDGTKVAFYRERTVEDPDDYDPATRLIVADANGSGERDLGRIHLTVEFVAPPAWSPDGRRVAWAEGVNCNEVICDDLQVWTADVRTGRRNRVARAAVDPAWSPDGRFIAYTRAERYEGTMGGTTWPAYRMSVVVARPNARAARTVARKAMSPAWSRDGKWLSFVGHDTPIYRDLIVAAPDGSRRKTVGSSELDPARWSPAGRWLATADTATGGQPVGVGVVRADGRGRRRLGPRATFDPGDPWAPDEEKLVWAEGGRLVIVHVGGGAAWTIASRIPGAKVRFPVWSRDGRRVFFSAGPASVDPCHRWC